MKKLKIDKIKLTDLSKNDQRNIIGGEAGVWTIGTIITIRPTTIGGTPDCPSQDQLTCKPGHQDSCGLCTTHQHCD